MIKILGWTVWAILPVIGLAYHFGPGQTLASRDKAARLIIQAREIEHQAEALQEVAYAAHLKTIDARRRAFVANTLDNTTIDNRSLSNQNNEITALLKTEKTAYNLACDQWKQTADLYMQATELLRKTDEDNTNNTKNTEKSDAIQWAQARARVRSGEVFNGIENLQILLDTYVETNRGHTDMATAIREELAAAQYVGARLLREEGRPATTWRQVSGAARQNFKYLAEDAITDITDNTDNTGNTGNAKTTAQLMQRNLEQVLNLEQSDRSQLDGMALPKNSPRGRRPGDGEPGKGKGKGKKGKGKKGKGPPQDGASGRMPYGPGW